MKEVSGCGGGGGGGGVYGGEGADPETEGLEDARKEER